MYIIRFSNHVATKNCNIYTFQSFFFLWQHLHAIGKAWIKISIKISIHHVHMVNFDIMIMLCWRSVKFPLENTLWLPICHIKLFSDPIFSNLMFKLWKYVSYTSTCITYSTCIHNITLYLKKKEPTSNLKFDLESASAPVYLKSMYYKLFCQRICNFFT